MIDINKETVCVLTGPDTAGVLNKVVTTTSLTTTTTTTTTTTPELTSLSSTVATTLLAFVGGHRK